MSKCWDCSAAPVEVEGFDWAANTFTVKGPNREYRVPMEHADRVTAIFNQCQQHGMSDVFWEFLGDLDAQFTMEVKEACVAQSSPVRDSSEVRTLLLNEETVIEVTTGMF